MMRGAFALVMSQILAVYSVTASKGLQCTSEGECSPDHVSMIQKLIDVSRHDRTATSEMTNALLHLKKEHFWALSQQGVVGKSGVHIDKISEKTMAALFGQKLKHLTAPEQAQLQRGISDAVRSNRTQTDHMMRALCWLDDLKKAESNSQEKDEATPVPEASSSSKDNSFSFSFDLNGLFNSLMNGKTSGEKSDSPADMPSPEAEPEPEGQCGDFSGKWIQQEERGDNDFGDKGKCEAYSAEGTQQGCSVTGHSDDAWWGHSVSLTAHGNKVQIKLSACSSKVFEGTLSDDGNTLSWNDGCKWTKVGPSLWTLVSNHWVLITVTAMLLTGFGTVAYFTQSSA